MWNVVPQCLRPMGRLTVRQAVGGLGREASGSEGPAVMVGYRVQHSRLRKEADIWLVPRHEVAERISAMEESQ